MTKEDKIEILELLLEAANQAEQTAYGTLGYQAALAHLRAIEYQLKLLKEAK